MGYVKNASSGEKEFAAAGVRVVLQGGKGEEVPALSPFESGVLERTDHFELSGRFDLIQWMGEIATKIGEKGFGDTTKDSLDLKEEVTITKIPEEDIIEVTEIPEDDVNPDEIIDEVVVVPAEIVPNEVIEEEDGAVTPIGDGINFDEKLDEEPPAPVWAKCLEADEPVEALKEFSGAELKGFCNDLEIADYGSKTEIANRILDEVGKLIEIVDEEE